MNAAKLWFAGLSDRERLLVAVAAILLALTLLVFLVVKPILSYRTASAERYEQAGQTALLVDRAVGSGGGGAEVSTVPIRTAVSDMADRNGLQIDRYDIQDDAIDVTVAAVPAATLYAWLGDLEQEHGVVVREGAVRSDGEGLVTARLTVARP